MSCEHDCTKPPVFPRAIYNRPGLSEIDYRIGYYAEIREYLLDRINKRPELNGWTHRGNDDPGIALLEAGAIEADILTFYQQLYANEAYLRTAKWQESVFELVKLLGYRPAPGVGGLATFAVKVKPPGPVLVPAQFGFKVKLEGDEKQSEFESSAEVTAWPHLGEFRLYRPRLAEANITPANAGNRLEIAQGTADIAEGDRIMLVPPAPMFDVTGTAYTTQAAGEVLVVSKVETVLDRTILTFEGAITRSRGARVDAYVLGRTFRHFGADSPPLTTTLTGNPPVAVHAATRFTRQIWGDDTPSSAEANYYSPILREDMPLDQEVGDLPAGGNLICEGVTQFDGVSAPVRFLVVRKIAEVRSDSLTWGNKSGSATIAKLDRRLIANTSILNEFADIRKLRFHEAVSEKLVLRAPVRWTSGAFTDTRLNFLGTGEEAATLRGRPLMLATDDGTTQQEVIVQDLPPKLAAGSQRMWQIELDRAPAFHRESFDEVTPTITVFGNLVPATQGKTQDEVVLGSGDARQEFQTFAIPKSPLTYLMPQAAQLSVYVSDVLWKRVDMLFGQKPDAMVYVVRQDDDGESWVQFGNGIMGARLPSGRNNVVATFRVGNAAAGAAEKDPQAAARLTGLDKVKMPAPAAGGAEAETQAVARVAAPGKMQSLGRLVSLADFETEALAIPGVLKSRAYWSAPDGIPQIEIVVLTEGGTSADLEFVRQTIAEYNRCRGPARHAITVTQGLRKFLSISLTVGYDPARRPEDVEAAARAALDELFSLDARTFGQSAHISQILGRVQQANGVRWVTPAKFLLKTFPCPPNRILALDAEHLKLNLAADDRKEVCS